MRKNVIIGCGSFIGAVLRYLVKGIAIVPYHGNLPFNTLFINVLGAFLLAFLLTILLDLWELDPDIRLGITTGLLGAFTTFSTLCKETVGLFERGDFFTAIWYLIATIMLGLGAAYLGVTVAREINIKLPAKKKR